MKEPSTELPGRLRSRTSRGRQARRKPLPVDASTREISPRSPRQATRRNLIDEAGRICDGSNEDRVVNRFALPRVLLQPLAGDADVLQPKHAYRAFEKGRLSFPGLEEYDASRWPDDRERDPRQPATAPDVEGSGRRRGE